MFVLQLLQSMHIKVKLPIIVHVDNVGATFMSNNVTTSGCTKHVDIYYKFVTEYVEVGIIKIIFVKSSDNYSDIMTKNLRSDIHSKHAGKMVSARNIIYGSANLV